MRYFDECYSKSHHSDYVNPCDCSCNKHCSCAKDPFYHRDCFLLNFSCSPFQTRLAGLQGNLNFQLFRFKGCPVIIEYKCKEGITNRIEGRICNVGTNFVDILQGIGCEKDKHQSWDKDCYHDRYKDCVITIMLERICTIIWPDKKCGPCKCCCDKCEKDFHDSSNCYKYKKEPCPKCGMIDCTCC